MNNPISSRRLRLESLEERALLAVTAGFAETAALAASTGATNWVVNTTADPSSWDTADDILSLREAIGRAQTGDTITFDASLAGGTITLNGTELSIIDKGITIDASDIGGITIDGDNVSNIFLVSGGSSAEAVRLVSLELRRSGIDNSGVLAMTDCSLWYLESEIDNSGVLVMTNCSVRQSLTEDAVTNTGSVSMTDCSFEGSISRGIYNGDTAQMTMLRCEVSECQGGTDGDLYGGGIYNGGTLTMTDCSVDWNFVQAGGSFYNVCNGYGGGIYNSGTLTMTNCSVSHNTIPKAKDCYGAGIYNAWSGTVTMANCTVSGNQGGNSNAYYYEDVYGGGIYNDGTMEMTNCTVSENIATMCCYEQDTVGEGGGIYSSGTLTMTNCAVVGNSVESDYYYDPGYYSRDGMGGGIYSSGTLTMTNCTVAGNSAEGGESGDGMGGGIFYVNGTVAYLYNTIIAQNTASSSGNDIYSDIYPDIVLYGYNCLSSYTDWGSGSSGCLAYDSSRLFTDTVGGDYSLAVISSSQAIDKGNNSYISGYETDLAGNPRIYNNGTVDLGAYESQSNLSDLETASTVVTTELDVFDSTDNLISLREAIFYAAAGDTVTFDESMAGKTITLDGSELKIDSSVSVDASSIGGMTIDADGKSRVFSVSGGTADAPVELDALTITGGKSTTGGGICNIGNLKLTGCNITGNSVSDNGGAVYNTGSLALTDCTVTGNSAQYGGAFNNTSSSAVLTLVNCTVSGNYSSRRGGGIYNYSGTANLCNTIIAQNMATSSGSDVYRSSGSIYAYNTLSSFTVWTKQENCLTYDSSQPLFSDVANSNYTLAENSQAINKGNNEYVETETDLAGNPRIVGGTIDLGAYEYQSGGGQTEPLAAPTITTGNKNVYVSYGANRHQIQWDAVENASGYELAYSADGNSWTTISASETSAVITGLTCGAAMRYRVRALGTGSYADSDWSAVKTFSVCPMDINGDGDISGGDRTLLGNSWLSEEGEDEFRYYCDISGDGDIGGADRAYLSNNWLLNVEDDADDLQYPPAKASDTVFAEFASADLAADLETF
ncbi:MAG: right-handed parallel beta-helix repeat-containing protein [Thermoguttaceae bacterium]|nr:right-handed parallel beta-helix repeat-containing protein [Thermoguttaceae bacterium]